MATGPWDHSTEEKMPFWSLFTRALIEWNNAETAVRGLLATSQGSASIGGWVVVYELSSWPMIHALRTLAHDVHEGDESRLIAHAADFFEVLVEHRNYYVHGIGGVITDPGTGVVTGSLGSTRARGRIAFDADDLTAEMLHTFMRHSYKLNEYCNAVRGYIAMKADDPPDLPSLPPRLVKTRKTLAEVRRESASPSSA